MDCSVVQGKTTSSAECWQQPYFLKTWFFILCLRESTVTIRNSYEYITLLRLQSDWTDDSPSLAYRWGTVQTTWLSLPNNSINKYDFRFSVICCTCIIKLWQGMVAEDYQSKIVPPHIWGRFHINSLYNLTMILLFCKLHIFTLFWDSVLT